ncbi:MAG: leucine-rich repeat protein [Acutalibacteraceae bacterium]
MQKRVLSIILALAMILSLAATISVTASAETYGDFEYVSSSDGTARITGYTGSAAHLDIPSEIDGYIVTYIAYEAFADCTTLKSVTIPDTVTSISERAFANTALYNDESNWTDGVLYIGNFLISGRLEICDEEAMNVEILTEVKGDYTVKDGTKVIADGAFAYCDSLTGITIPESVIYIGECTFCECTSLTDVSLPNSITTIDFQTFSGCISLNEITIPDSVAIIDDCAFEHCSSLSDVTVPDGVESIGDSAFRNCEALSSITIPDSVTYIGAYAFENTAVYNNESNWTDGALYIDNHLISGIYRIYNEQTDEFSIITEVKGDYTVKDGTISIADEAFYECTALTGITIPDSVQSISDRVFYKCTALASVTLPDSITSIGYHAFAYCRSLSSVTIPDSVTDIYYWAFFDCPSLASVTIPDTVTYIDDEAFGYYFEDYAFIYPKVPDFHIYCYPDTAGEQYAIKNEFDYTLIDNSISVTVNGIDITADNGAKFPEGTEFRVDKAESDADEYNIALKALGTDKIEVYDITATKDGEAVQPAPNGIVTATFSVPDDFDIDDTMVYYVSESGDFEPMMCTIDVENRKITAQLKHFSMYVVAAGVAFKYGDANGDGNINMLDVLLIRKYIAKQPVTPNLDASDVTADGNVNMLDVLLIRKYIAKQPVTLGPQG